MYEDCLYYWEQRCVDNKYTYIIARHYIIYCWNKCFSTHKTVVKACLNQAEWLIFLSIVKSLALHSVQWLYITLYVSSNNFFERAREHPALCLTMHCNQVSSHTCSTDCNPIKLKWTTRIPQGYDYDFSYKEVVGLFRRFSRTEV